MPTGLRMHPHQPLSPPFGLAWIHWSLVMKQWSREFDLLLSAPDPFEAEMARAVLASHGIPSFAVGADRGLCDLGGMAHAVVSRPDLLVPRGMGERARELLEEAWGGVEADELEREALANLPEPELSPRTSVPSLVRGILLAIGVVVSVYYVTNSSCVRGSLGSAELPSR